MSNKKKRNKAPASDSIEIESLIEPAIGNSASSKTGLISYLKAHLWTVGIICFVTLGVLGAGLKYLDDDAQRELARRAGQKGNLNNQQPEPFLNKINPFLPVPDTTPTPQLTRSYIYAGSRLLAVENANANSAPTADLAIWRPGTGYWWIMNPNGSQQITQGWGLTSDKPAPGDYDGDGKTDFAVYRPATSNPPTQGSWWIMRSSDNTYFSTVFGAVDDERAQADYDGDGRTDAALFRPTTGDWYILLSSTNQLVQWHFGTNGDKPAPADYDGDGKADLGVWRSSQYAFYSSNSSNGGVQSPTFGATATGHTVVSADYDGDGRADHAIYNSDTATWYIWQSTNGQLVSNQWGAAADKPVQNDYDGDGRVDIAVWRDSTGDWYIKNSSTGGTRTEHWGASGDIPVPAFYRR